jgi:hypothetical protein
LSNLSDIATLLMFTAAIIWIPGVVVIKAAEHFYGCNERRRAADRLAERR